MTSSNPLLDFSDLPRFDDLRAEPITPALDALLADAAAAIERACSPDTPATWEEVVHPAERATQPLARAWGVVGHLNAAADTPGSRALNSTTRKSRAVPRCRNVRRRYPKNSPIMRLMPPMRIRSASPRRMSWPDCRTTPA